MATQKSSGTRVPAAENNLTVDRLLSTPLADLLAEVNAEIVDTDVSDPKFLGQVVKPRSGATLLAMPTGRSAFERDTVARILVAKLYGAPMRPVPSSLDVRTFGGAR